MVAIVQTVLVGLMSKYVNFWANNVSCNRIWCNVAGLQEIEVMVSMVPKL